MASRRLMSVLVDEGEPVARAGLVLRGKLRRKCRIATLYGCLKIERLRKGGIVEEEGMDGVEAYDDCESVFFWPMILMRDGPAKMTSIHFLIGRGDENQFIAHCCVFV